MVRIKVYCVVTNFQNLLKHFLRRLFDLSLFLKITETNNKSTNSCSLRRSFKTCLAI